MALQATVVPTGDEPVGASVGLAYLASLPCVGRAVLRSLAYGSQVSPLAMSLQGASVGPSHLDEPDQNVMSASDEPAGSVGRPCIPSQTYQECVGPH